MEMQNLVFNLLPQTDCQKCGRNTCQVFAIEVAHRQTCVEACPDITDEAERVLRNIIAAEHEMASWLWGMVSGISRNQVKSTFRILKEVFIMLPIRVVSLLLFTLPLTLPFLAVAIWIYNK